MKKFILFNIFLISLLVLTTGCNLQRDNLRGATINTTLYPIEYLTSVLYSGMGPTLSIYPDGTNPLEYNLTDKQLADASNVGIFVFNGHGKERDYARTMIMENRNLKLIDATNNIEYEHNVHELWLDPINALILARNIRTGLTEYFPSIITQREINERFNQLEATLSSIDAELKLMASNADHNTLIFMNDSLRFFERHGYNVITLEDGPNFSRNDFNEARRLLRTGQNKYIFLLDGQEPNRHVQNLVRNYDATILYLDEILMVTEEHRSDGETFITRMNNNLETLRRELYR